jgi:NADH:ubiquinone reductase (H+-translocating)
VKGLTDDKFGHAGRILVDQFSKVRGTANIFALGDISLVTDDPSYPHGHPQLAQVAIQQGKLLARNFSMLDSPEKWIPFRYKDKGSMAIISKYKAIADLPSMSVKGFTAWLMWLFIHLIPIAGFRNKVDLVFNWAWSFLTNDPTLRLIIRPERNEFIRESHHIPAESSKDGKKVVVKEVATVDS